MYNFSRTKVLSNGLQIASIKLSRFDKYWGITLSKGVMHIGLGNKQISIWRDK